MSKNVEIGWDRLGNETGKEIVRHGEVRLGWACVSVGGRSPWLKAPSRLCSRVDNPTRFRPQASGRMTDLSGDYPSEERGRLLIGGKCEGGQPERNPAGSVRQMESSQAKYPSEKSGRLATVKASSSFPGEAFSVGALDERGGSRCLNLLSVRELHILAGARTPLCQACGGHCTWQGGCAKWSCSSCSECPFGVLRSDLFSL